MTISGYYKITSETISPFGYIVAKEKGAIEEHEAFENYVPFWSLAKKFDNLKIHPKIEEEPNQDLWHADYNIVGGDCEDFALTMRKILYEDGYYSGHIGLTQNGKHAVLVVPTEDGAPYVVDINEDAPRSVANYGVGRIQKIETQGKWFNVEAKNNFFPIFLGTVIFATALSFLFLQIYRRYKRA